MRNQNERGVAPGFLRQNEIDDRRAGFRIEISGRLVRRQNDGVGRKRARERDALLLPAGQLRGVMRQPVAEPNRLELGGGPLERVGTPGQFKRRGDVLQRRHGWNELERLEHHPYLLSAKARELVFVERSNVAIIDEDAPAVGTLQTGERHQKRGFPRTRGSNNSHRLAVRYAQADVLQHMHPRGAASQSEVDVDEFYDGVVQDIGLA